MRDTIRVGGARPKPQLLAVDAKYRLENSVRIDMRNISITDSSFNNYLLSDMRLISV